MKTETANSKYVIKNRDVSKQVTDIICNQIIDGQYAIGELIPTEETLCNEFGIGRSSVREAIKTLESRGMVRKIQGKGVVVVDECIEATSELLRIALAYQKTSLRDLMNFRVSLELTTVDLAARNATEKDLERMREQIECMVRQEYTQGDFAQHDYLFHEAIAKASGNSVILLIIKTLRPLLYNQIVYTLDPKFNPELATNFHEAIYRAIEAKHPEVAVEAMRSHLSETQRIINQLEPDLKL
ncbi:MAG: FadR/GntR family transcriptional regulator [Rikenellaceae bacterium]